MTSAQEVKALKDALDAHHAKCQDKYVKSVSTEAALLLAWIHYLRSVAKNPKAMRLLNAVQGTIIEVAGCLTIGFVRPAIFSLRVQLELLLAWMYFEDHAVELSKVEMGKDFPLRASHLKYLHDYGENFTEKLKLLEKRSSRTHKDPYGILSTYVHSTSPYAAPQVGPLASLVSKESTCDECSQFQREVAEYLTDVLSAWFARNWVDFPLPIQSHLSSRLTPKELAEFCS